jgi:hypothetical protein
MPCTRFESIQISQPYIPSLADTANLQVHAVRPEYHIISTPSLCIDVFNRCRHHHTIGPFGPLSAHPKSNLRSAPILESSFHLIMPLAFVARCAFRTANKELTQGSHHSAIINADSKMSQVLRECHIPAKIVRACARRPLHQPILARLAHPTTSIRSLLFQQ